MWLLQFPVSFFHWLVIFVLYQSEHLNHITRINVAWWCAIFIRCTEALLFFADQLLFLAEIVCLSCAWVHIRMSYSMHG